MNYLEKFNVTIAEFVADLVKVLPNDPELCVYAMVLGAAIKSNPHYVFDMFNSTVVDPYGDQIISRNEEFFLQEDYAAQIGENKDSVQFVGRIKLYWKDMSSDDKEIIWKYFRVLVMLSRKVVLDKPI